MTNIQKQFWTINQFLENDNAYNIVSSARLNGCLDYNRLQESWLKMLAMLFPEKYDQTELSLVECFKEEDAFILIQKEINTPFDLEFFPLKGLIFKLSINESIIVIIQHHILTDLHSVKIISRILSDFYNANQTDAEVLEYTEELDESRKKPQLNFWADYLKKSPEPLILPTSKSERAIYKGYGYTEFSSPSPKQSSKILLFCRENGFQPFLFLLSAYSVFLSKISGQKDFFIGIPFTNRRSDDRKKMCGPFINILPLRISLDSEKSLLDLYNSIRTQMLILHRNQEIPFQEIVHLYNGTRDPLVPYLLQVGFTKEEPFSLNLEGIQSTTINIRPEGSQMDLFLTYWMDNGVIHFRWEYNSEAFTKVQISSWMESFSSIIENLIKNDKEKIGKIPFVPHKIFKRYKSFFQQNSRQYPLEIPLRSSLLECYKQFSANPAIKDESRNLNYNEFSEIIKKYSHCIYNKIGKDKTVAIILNRSIERMALIHAIICSGNSYLPIDPLWPKERIGFLLSNADSVLAITDESLLERIPSNHSTLTIRELNSHKEMKSFPEILKQPDDQIAVLYTSGSTGNPKGVKISGRGIVNRLTWMQETYPIGPGDTMIHKVPYTFDVSIWEIFWPFLSGAELFIPDPIKHIEDEYLMKVIDEHKVTYVHFVPSLLKNFLRNTKNLNMPELKGIICSGEALEVSLVKEFYERLPGKDLHNLYGPTEASIDVTAWTCSSEDLKRRQIPIGYPIANTRIYILNEDLQLCPYNVQGEIAIAGVNLAQGYVNNEEETAKRFIKGDWGWGEENVYLTGDLGYYNPNCSVEYSGRKDFQIKINGIRIELAEIERQLEKHPGIKSAVVLVDKNSTEKNQLTAYIVKSESLFLNELHKKLYTFLPGYMIPQSYCFLDEFPLLPNGKVDRNQLFSTPATQKEIVGKEIKHSISHSSYENILREIWQKILKIENISSQSNFFDLGGHSLLLPTLKSEIEKVSAREIELMDLFKYPTLISQIHLLKDEEKTETKEKVEHNQRERMRKLALRNRNSQRK